MREDGIVRLLENGEVGPAQLRALAIATDQHRCEVEQRVRVASLVVDVDMLRTESPFYHPGEVARRFRGRESAVGTAIPLHRRSHGHTLPRL
jgi:hypothetical protein